MKEETAEFSCSFGNIGSVWPSDIYAAMHDGFPDRNHLNTGQGLSTETVFRQKRNTAAFSDQIDDNVDVVAFNERRRRETSFLKVVLQCFIEEAGF